MARPRRTCIGSLLALAVSTAGAHASAAWAQANPSPAQKAQAVQLVNRAQQACAGGEHDDALAALAAALQAYPHARIRYRAGVEHQHLGHLVEAIEAFEGYLSEPEREPEYVADAVSRINQIRPNVGSVEILAESGAVVAIDGRERGQTPLARVRVAAGAHRVSVTKPGFAPFRSLIQVVGGQTAGVTAILRPGDGTGSAPIAHGETRASQAAAAPSPIEIGLLVSGGVWTAGVGETATTVGVTIGGSYRLTGDQLSIHLGPRVTANTIDDLGRTVYATGFLLAPLVRLALVPQRFSASFELGGGLMVLWGLRPRSMLLIPQSSAVTGGLSTFALRPVLSFEYALARDVALLTGMSAVWAPKPDPAFRESYLMRFDFAVGLSWAL